jgi:Pyruvate/2-oxoacid:ferredoxin oxidoreductase gamma subunit
MSEQEIEQRWNEIKKEGKTFILGKEWKIPDDNIQKAINVYEQKNSESLINPIKYKNIYYVKEKYYKIAMIAAHDKKILEWRN